MGVFVLLMKNGYQIIFTDSRQVIEKFITSQEKPENNFIPSRRCFKDFKPSSNRLCPYTINNPNFHIFAKVIKTV